MTELYKNKYRIKSTRLSGWDYSWPGLYFITICTHNREPFFGTVINGVNELSPFGKIVSEEWKKSFKIRFELICDEYVIMPNHIHGIIGITRRDVRPDVSTTGTRSDVRTIGIDRASLQSESGRTSIPMKNPVLIKPKSISSFMAGFKSIVTKRINEMRRTPGNPVWQSRFYDHIIRDNGELNRIREYILNNPANWQNDEYIPHISNER